jgi:hypothetical protein
MEAVESEYVDIAVNKMGPSGRPVAMITAASSVPLDKLSAVIQREITRNDNLRTKLGLKACPACAASGIDLDIRHRFDHVLRVNLNQGG